MNTLNKFSKIIQSIGNIDFKNTVVNIEKNESAQAIQYEGEPLSNDSNSLLFLINTEENEYLFI
jgi:hypothetical protein